VPELRSRRLTRGVRQRREWEPRRAQSSQGCGHLGVRGEREQRCEDPVSLVRREVSATPRGHHVERARRPIVAKSS
jgi:hypothetical protein